MTVYALLDFDGYICKAFFASHSKKGTDKNEYAILSDLYFCSINKVINKYDIDESEVKVIPVVSGHSWKRDLFPQYKANRKRNKELGNFRNEIISQDGDIIKINQLEADEIIIMLKEYINNIEPESPVVVFSDDKDLKYYSDIYCKININEEIETLNPDNNLLDRYKQMLAGDKEDDITGVPRMGMKIAEKLLNQTQGELNLSKIIKVYKNNNVSYNDCLEQLALIIPAGAELVLNDNILARNILCGFIMVNIEVDDLIVQELIKNTLEAIKDKVDIIYG